MIPVKFDIRDRGATPRGMARRMNAMKKVAWDETGLLFHVEMRDKRFSKAHARAAGYAPRTHAYTMRKLKAKKHALPLVWSGKTRRDVREASIAPTSNQVKVRYRGARALNFRNPKSQVRAAVEFTTITQAEANTLAAEFDRVLDRQLNRDQTENP
jgi:hypothetical protein